MAGTRDPGPETTHISCLELGKFKKPAHAAQGRKRQICNAGSGNKTVEFLPPAGVGLRTMDSLPTTGGSGGYGQIRFARNSAEFRRERARRPGASCCAGLWYMACRQSTASSLNKQIHKQTSARNMGICLGPRLIP